MCSLWLIRGHQGQNKGASHSKKSANYPSVKLRQQTLLSSLIRSKLGANDDGIINLRVTKGKTGFRHSFSTELGLDFYNHLKRINCDYSKLDNFLFLPKWKTGHTQTGHSNECSIMSWKPTISNWIKTGNQGQLIH